jgi:transcriptional regulator with GAF, ATPase, and Fis domain
VTTVGTEEPISRFWSKIGLIANIARVLREKPAGKKTLVEVLEMILRVIGFESATLYLLNKKDGALDEVASCGRPVNLIDFLHFGRGFGLAGWVAKQERPVLIRGRDPERDSVREHHDSVFVLPLMVRNELVGVLCFSHHDPDGFDENRRKVLEIAADQVAVSIECIIYQRELELRNQSLMEAQQKLKEAQDKLIAQEKLKAVIELAASVNHEVNNPLSAIIGNAQMIELETSDMPPEIVSRIGAIVDGARRISLITHKLLKIDKLVSESYLGNDTATMLNIHESAGDG